MATNSIRVAETSLVDTDDIIALLCKFLREIGVLTRVVTVAMNKLNCAFTFILGWVSITGQRQHFAGMHIFTLNLYWVDLGPLHLGKINIFLLNQSLFRRQWQPIITKLDLSGSAHASAALDCFHENLTRPFLFVLSLDIFQRLVVLFSSIRVRVTINLSHLVEDLSQLRGVNKFVLALRILLALFSWLLSLELCTFGKQFVVLYAHSLRFFGVLTLLALAEIVFKVLNAEVSLSNILLVILFI